LWTADDYEYATERTLPNTNNLGLQSRYEITGDGKVFEMSGRLFHPLFQLKEFLPPKLEIRLKLYRKDANFCLVSPDETAKFNINLSDIKLNVRMVRLVPRIHAALEKKLNTTPALYTLYDSPDVETRNLSKDLKSFTIENLFGSKKLPSRVIIALTTHENYLGSLKTTPLHFPHYGLAEISLTIDNYTRTYKMDWKNNLYMELFVCLARELGNKDMDCSPNIKYGDIPNLALYPFDLTESHTMDDLQIPTHKNVRLELKFDTALTEPLQLLVISLQPEMFTIDKNRVLVNSIEIK
jgi:hypothetical protein